MADDDQPVKVRSARALVLACVIFSLADRTAAEAAAA